MQIFLFLSYLAFIISYMKKEETNEDYTLALCELYQFIKSNHTEFEKIFSLFDSYYNKVTQTECNTYSLGENKNAESFYYAQSISDISLLMISDHRFLEEISFDQKDKKQLDITSGEIIIMNKKIDNNICVLEKILKESILFSKKLSNKYSSFRKSYVKFVKNSNWSFFGYYNFYKFEKIIDNLHYVIKKIKNLSKDYTKNEYRDYDFFPSICKKEHMQYEKTKIFLYHGLIRWLEKIIFMIYEVQYLESKTLSLKKNFTPKNYNDLLAQYVKINLSFYFLQNGTERNYENIFKRYYLRVILLKTIKYYYYKKMTKEYKNKQQHKDFEIRSYFKEKNKLRLIKEKILKQI